MTDPTPPVELRAKPAKTTRQWVYDLTLALLLIVAAYLRFTGLAWDDDQYLHPDERFLTMVETALVPVDNFSDYWDTENSTMNPNNVGYGFFVYGTLPIFLVRYIGEWTGNVGWSEIQMVGRQLSAISDLLVVFVVYLTATRAFDRRVGIVAAAFTAFAVLEIQLSHFFAVDTFLNLFTLLSIYIAIWLATDQPQEGQPTFKPLHFVLFGLALGMAASTKASSFPVALAIPLAVIARLSRMEKAKRYDAAWMALSYLVLAAGVSLVTFRIFQPYAFSGPGFFGILPNDKWVGTMKELLNQQTGDLDWPPSIQWARRPIWFSFQNMTLWGMGIPMSIMAWTGFLWAGWQMLKGKWQTHLVIWSWTALYFAWQSNAFNPTMRYQIPVYPTFAIFAGWAVIGLWDAAGKAAKRRMLLRGLAGTAGAAALALTALWAFAFMQIYTRPVTRVAASDWIYQNVPGPLNLKIDTGSGEIYNQPLSFSYNLHITDSLPYFTTFMPKYSGTVNQIEYKTFKVQDEQYSVNLWIGAPDGLEIALAQVSHEIDPADGTLQSLTLALMDPVVMLPGQEYEIRIEGIPDAGEMILMDGAARLVGGIDEVLQPLVAEPAFIGAPDYAYTFIFSPEEAVSLWEVSLDIQLLQGEYPTTQTFRLRVDTDPNFGSPLAAAEISVDLSNRSNQQGGMFDLSQPVELVEGELYYLQIENLTAGGSVTMLGAAVANEGPWDDGLPMRTSGYDGYSGIYPPDVNFDMYADDTPDKLALFLDVLEQSEYLTISSSRQWGSTPRIPERYPLNVTYYRHLLGCPEEKTIEWCYNVAKPGMFQGDLGFELIKVFQSDPNLGSFRINDQASEEAFTVYDHPKVFIFQKTEDYDPARVATILGSVDFNAAIRLTPVQSDHFKSLLLTEEAENRQRAAGTWSQLFDTDQWFNRSGIGAVLVWYLLLSLLGWAFFPLLRRALPGLPDQGFPLARAAAMLVLAYLSWLAGSLGLSYSRPVILTIYLLLLALGIWQAVAQRAWLLDSLRKNWRSYLIAEAVFLAGFVLVLLVRYGNPDLWHLYKGGEKPMDFSYFNAVLKSESFPAYDPWYAGGYINYYYFGFVFVGTLVKMIGIVPAVAYNIVLPTVFAMLFAGAYSVAWNLYAAWQGTRQGKGWTAPAWTIGLSAAIGTGLLGNLGTIKLMVEGFQKLAAQGAYVDQAGFFIKLGWTFKGIIQMVMGSTMPFGLGDWYWIPSRIIPAGGDVEPITEFPWFTTIYADLHAHFMALPITVLALAWALSVVLSKAWKNTSRWQVGWSLVFGGIVIGVLRPTNTWDLPTYLTLAIVAVLYAVWRYAEPPQFLTRRFNPGLSRTAMAIGAAVVLGVLSFVLYQPYANAYAQPYSEISIWKGSHTTVGAYLMHWGLFLFVLIFWMGWETRQWMAATPLSALRKLEKYKKVLWAALGLALLVMVILLGLKVQMHLFALPLAVWALALLFRPGMADSKRAVLFLVGTALFLTMMVEVIVLSGDIGRMNTVFKFYLQAWTLFAASSAAALGWLMVEFHLWNVSWRVVWSLGMFLLVFFTAMFPVSATTAKIKDRMTEGVPHTLDGMAYMRYSEHWEEGQPMDLEQDYDAIRWMQENVSGTPVIVEANIPIYHWGSRFSIYTGLPGVLGWDWHQIQQRGFTPASKIAERLADIQNFYWTEDQAVAQGFLEQYKVEYIIVGQLERIYYAGAGLDKFELLDGVLWQEVHRTGQTVIYRVLDPATSALGEGGS